MGWSLTVVYPLETCYREQHECYGTVDTGFKSPELNWFSTFIFLAHCLYLRNESSMYYCMDNVLHNKVRLEGDFPKYNNTNIVMYG